MTTVLPVEVTLILNLFKFKKVEKPFLNLFIKKLFLAGCVEPYWLHFFDFSPLCFSPGGCMLGCGANGLAGKVRSLHSVRASLR